MWTTPAATEMRNLSLWPATHWGSHGTSRSLNAMPQGVNF